MSDTIEVEIDTPKNGDAYFQPLKRKLRGRFDALRDASKSAAKRFPKPIPGQHLLIDTANGDCFVTEPLYEEEHRVSRETIEKRGFRLPERREVHRGGHVPTLLHWVKNLVDAGLARVVSGKLPDKIDGKPRLRFHGEDRPDKDKVLADAVAAQTAAVDRQTAVFEALLRELTKKRG
ncbi:MAG TPA: hypothetical protein VG826_29550 [Pirellulales bacterium]|nr:hypothetical protein [Pirellulales bacterium]